jgi:hypothetical protein
MVYSNKSIGPPLGPMRPSIAEFISDVMNEEERLVHIGEIDIEYGAELLCTTVPELERILVKRFGSVYSGE